MRDRRMGSRMGDNLLMASRRMASRQMDSRMGKRLRHPPQPLPPPTNWISVITKPNWDLMAIGWTSRPTANAGFQL